LNEVAFQGKKPDKIKSSPIKEKEKHLSEVLGGSPSAKHEKLSRNEDEEYSFYDNTEDEHSIKTKLKRQETYEIGTQCSIEYQPLTASV